MALKYNKQALLQRLQQTIERHRRPDCFSHIQPRFLLHDMSFHAPFMSRSVGEIYSSTQSSSCPTSFGSFLRHEVKVTG